MRRRSKAVVVSALSIVALLTVWRVSEHLLLPGPIYTPMDLPEDDDGFILDPYLDSFSLVAQKARVMG